MKSTAGHQTVTGIDLRRKAGAVLGMDGRMIAVMLGDIRIGSSRVS